MPFENSQQLGLAFPRQLANFVEEQRARVGLLKKADMIAIGSRERAGLVAEKLAFHQLAGNRGAIDRQQRPIGTRAGPMDRPRDQLLARPAFAANQHAAVGAGDAVDSLLQFAHRRAIADQFAVAWRLSGQPLVVGFQTAALPGADQRHDHDVGRGDRHLEVALLKPSAVEIDVQCPERRFLMDQRHADRVRIVEQTFAGFVGLLLGDPHGATLAADQFGERMAQIHRLGRSVGNDQFRPQPLGFVDPQKTNDRRTRFFAKHFERHAGHFVGLVEPQ